MKFMIYRRKTELLFNTLNNCVRYLETTNHSFDACATSSVEVSERNKGGEKPRGKEAENVSLSRDQLRSREGCGTEGEECDIATSNEEYDDRNCGDDRASLKNVFHKEKKIRSRGMKDGLIDIPLTLITTVEPGGATDRTLALSWLDWTTALIPDRR